MTSKNVRIRLNLSQAMTLYQTLETEKRVYEDGSVIKEDIEEVEKIVSEAIEGALS